MSKAETLIREAVFPADRDRLLTAVETYLAWLDVDLSHRGLDEEMANFDARFTLPSGLFFLAERGSDIAGCVGFVRHPGNRAEVKRLFVYPAFRGEALGKRLVEAVIDRTTSLGFDRLMLDVVPETGFAIALYERLGFTECEPFYDRPLRTTRFFGMTLR